MKKFFMAMGLLAVVWSVAADKIREGDAAAAKKDFAQAVRLYDEAFFSEGEPDYRARAGFKSAALKLRQGFWNDAFKANENIALLSGVSETDQARAYENMARIALYNLNNIYRATSAAGKLKALKSATAAQKKTADEILDKCRKKKESYELLPEELPKAKAIAAKIRPDHPRMFFNRDTWPLVLKHLERPEIQAYYQKYVKEPAAAAPADPQLWTGEQGQTKTPDSRYVKTDRPSFYGLPAAQCALVYLVEKDPAYLEKAIRLLEVSAEAADESYKAGVLADDNYYNSTMIYTLAAFDWLYNELTPEQRQKIGKSLLMYSARSEMEGGRFVVAVGFPEESGFYGIRMLKFYAALATLGSGIDEKVSLKLLYEGYTDHEIMMRERDNMTGDDGGIVAPANNYTMSTYLWTTFNYLQNYQSATGEQRADQVRHLKYFPQWCVWNLINGREQLDEQGRPYYLHDFGVGDTGNTLKPLPNIDLYMYEIMHLVPDDPVLKQMAMAGVVDNPLKVRWPTNYRILQPILLYGMPEIPEKFERPDVKLKDHARFFENIGMVFMRSGTTPGDTYACFVTNKKYLQHRQYDANSFQIYKHDFLALDTGTRIGFQRNDYEQLNAYYAQTVAHNAVLIHMPEEEMPHYWVTPRKRFEYFNHGGQNRTVGDRCVAYETNDDFTYVAGDATLVYTAEKCRLALRQIVFIYPDYFVIADRVISSKPEYKKEWLLHFQNEPVFDDRHTFHADDGGGRLFCRTLLPLDAVATVVGGPGKEFFSSGKNWELPDEAKKYAETKNYLGRYRVEVAPDGERESEFFLHVIQVGKDTLPKMVETKLLEDDRSFGVEMTTERGTWQVRFARSGPAAGTIRLVDPAGETVFDRPFRHDVQPQSGLE